MRNNYLSKLVTFNPSDRLGQTASYDGKNNTAVATFAFNKPIELSTEGQIGLRSAYVPITYKNVIEGFNDRFYIRFRPANNTVEDDCVFITVQLKAGQYDTLTAYASMINTILAGLTTTTATTLTSAGGFTYTYTADTDRLLTHAMTCVVDTSAENKNHLKFSIAVNVKFHNTSVVTKDGGDVASDAIDGGFQITFGLNPGTDTILFSSDNRPANKFLGFSDEYIKSIDGVNYPSFPVNAITRASHAVVNVVPPSVGSVLFTPYIYIRCSLVTDSIETVPQGSKMSNLLAKIPVTSSGYGDAIFLEPSSDTLFFTLHPGSIQNIQLSLTDSNGRELPLIESEWEISLVIRGNIYS